MTAEQVRHARADHRRTPRLAVQAAALVLLLSSPVWIYALFFSYDTRPPSSQFLIVPVLVLVVLAPLIFLSSREPFLREVVVVGVFFKVAATAAFLFMSFVIYQGAADIILYFRIGKYIAEVYNSTGRLQLAEPYWFGVQFLYNVTGLLFIVVGSSVVVGNICFSLVAFVGQYLMYRAFTIAYPHGDRRMAAVLLFLLPSIAFWTAVIGKDALSLFFIGSAVYGFALLERHGTTRAFLPLLFGLGGLLCVRPHVAGMLATAFAVPYAFGRNRQGARGVLVKLVGIPLLVAVTFYFAYEAQEYLGMDDVSQAGYVLNREAAASKTGASAFGTASAGARALGAPFLFFRPFPWEVHNLQAGIACLESMLLLVITWRLRRQILYALRQHWQNGFTLFLILFLGEFSIIFSACISNFGLLARERTMAVPLYVMLLCMIPPRVVSPRMRTSLHAAPATLPNVAVAPRPLVTTSDGKY